MRFTFTVDVEVDRVEGKFASRDELADQIMSELEAADPGDLTGDNGGTYEVTSFEVSEIPQEKRRRKAS
jgi:hypothetical protein